MSTIWWVVLGGLGLTGAAGLVLGWPAARALHEALSWRYDDDDEWRT